MSDVTWLGDAGDGLSDDFIRRLSDELRATFNGQRDPQITVTRQFRGYSWAPEEKIVLGVEVRDQEDYHTHVVKLGTREEAARDFDGWQKCIRGQNFASRILMRLRKQDLPEERVAVVYQDGYSLFGNGPTMFEDVVSWSMTDRGPEPASVERAIYQIFTDLNRWCYRHARPNSDAAHGYYAERLDRQAQLPGRVLDRWRPSDDMSEAERINAQWRWEIRRDATWLFRGPDPPLKPDKHVKPNEPVKPDQAEELQYIDACDFLYWAVETGNMPETLVGKSHGDLHGRNVLVGVERGQVDYPAVFDYGEMDDLNVIAWDFVKLETELKVRLLPKLYQEPDAWEKLGIQREAPARLNGTCESIERKNRLQFALRFETQLAKLTHLILSADQAESIASIPPHGLFGHTAVDRALAILLRIRKEAALWLGFKRQRIDGWRDEYFYCLSVYGVCNVKWKYTQLETECAVVSAGVAAANLSCGKNATKEIIATATSPQPPFPSYWGPLVWAYSKWSQDDSEAGLALLGAVAGHFDHVVPLKQTEALLLIEVGKHAEADALLGDLRGLAVVFRDFEALSRIGRISKDGADNELEREMAQAAFGLNDMRQNAWPAWQLYRQAFEAYSEGYEVSGEYYPAINAATLAFLIGDMNACHKYAGIVKDLAREMDDDPWLFASEGEASLLLDDIPGAANYYRAALDRLPAQRKQWAESMYKQVCRLWWALGADKVAPVVEKFRDWEASRNVKLAPGPLGDCGRPPS